MSPEFIMRRELLQCPEVVAHCVERYSQSAQALLSESLLKTLALAPRVYLIGCGSSYHACLAAQSVFAQYLGVDSQAAVASEFCRDTDKIPEGSVVLAVSQSGDTFDTLAAVARAQTKKLVCIAVVNNSRGALGQTCQAMVLTAAGKEISIPATKSFAAQQITLILLAFAATRAYKADTSPSLTTLLAQLKALPHALSQTLGFEQQVIAWAKTLAPHGQWFVLGSQLFVATAMEVALKLKECAQIAAEALVQSEIMHGPLAIVQKDTPVLLIGDKVGSDAESLRVLKHLNQIGSRIYVLGTNLPSNSAAPLWHHQLEAYPMQLPIAQHMVSCALAQLLAYHIGVIKGCNVDVPPNLRKAIEGNYV